MTSIDIHTRRPNTQENVSSFLIFIFQLMFIFRIFALDSYVSADDHEKHVFHNAPFHSTSHVLKSFRYLDVSKRVSNWNKGKILIFIGSILQKCQLDVPVFIYKLMRQISLWITVSYGFLEFYRVAIWNKGKRFILVIHHFKYANWIYWFHIQRKRMSNINMYIQKSNC